MKKQIVLMLLIILSINQCNKIHNMKKCDCKSSVDTPICCTQAFPNLNEVNSNPLLNDSAFNLQPILSDSETQQNLANKAKLQVELFQKAQEFAKETAVQELKARDAELKLKEATKNAAISRSELFKNTDLLRVYAENTLNSITPLKCKGGKCGAALNPIGAYNNNQKITFSGNFN